jgi:hypothetical protein
MANKKVASVVLTPEEIEKRAAELEIQKTNLETLKLQLDEQKTAQDAKDVQLSETESALAKKAKDLEAREISVQQAEENASKPKETKSGKKFKFEGVEYKFKDSAPENIRFNGSVKSQAQLIKDEDALLQLVGGNSGLIEKI